MAGVLFWAAIGAASAQEAPQPDESPLHALARAIGLAAEPQSSADFVKSSRPDAPTDSIPVFADPKEPSSSVRSPAQLKAMDAELEAAAKAHQKLRAAEGVPTEAVQLKAPASPDAKKADAKKRKDAASAKN
jgi:hypothetical protein